MTADEMAEAVAVAVDAEGVGKRQRNFASSGARDLSGADEGFFRFVSVE